jgi:hypothetical protein
MGARIFRSGIACLVIAFAVCAINGSAFSQAGSTGGTIGKTDKSISGGEDNSSRRKETSRRSENPNSERQELLPNTIRLNEHAFGINYFVTLQKVGGNLYEGTWNHGYATKFTVTGFTKDSLKMSRTDNPALGAVTSAYTGQRIGNSANGHATHSNGAQSSWDASW